MKQTLFPLEEPLNNEVCTNARICLVDGKKFMDGLRHDNVCFALIPKKTEKPEPKGEHQKEIKNLLTEYEDKISNNVPNGFPTVRSISHCMDLVPKASLPNKDAHRLTLIGNEELNRQLQELLKKGLIRESQSPCAVPAVLVPKKNREWRMCINSREINKITVKYQFPLPRMDDIMDYLSGEKYFTMIDLKSGYHHIRIRESDEWKTTFKTNEGLYEWLLMPFGLTNTPSTFMRLVNEVLRKFLGKFVIVYLDDVLKFSKTKEEHLLQLRQVLKRLREEKVLINIRKCTFMKDELVYLGFLIFEEGLKMDPEKVKAIVEWPTSKSIGEVRSLHGLASFYQKFIRNFSSICNPLTDTMRGDEKEFKWTNGENKIFQLLKHKVIEQTMLALLDFNKVFQVDYDASGTTIGVVLSQEGRAVAYFNDKLNDSRRIYLVYDQEFYAIVQALKKWRHYLFPKEFVLYTYHQDLQYLNSQSKLNQRHMRWVEFMQSYTFVLKHISGKSNKVVDALSRRRKLLKEMRATVLGFEDLKTLYDEDSNFVEP